MVVHPASSVAVGLAAALVALRSALPWFGADQHSPESEGQPRTVQTQEPPVVPSPRPRPRPSKRRRERTSTNRSARATPAADPTLGDPAAFESSDRFWCSWVFWVLQQTLGAAFVAWLCSRWENFRPLPVQVGERLPDLAPCFSSEGHVPAPVPTDPAPLPLQPVAVVARQRVPYPSGLATVGDVSVLESLASGEVSR